MLKETLGIFIQYYEWGFPIQIESKIDKLKGNHLKIQNYRLIIIGLVDKIELLYAL